MRQFEYHLQGILGYGLDYEMIHQDPATWFSFDPEHGLRPSISSHSEHFHRDQLLALATGDLTEASTQTTSKQIFASILKFLLGDKSLFIHQILPKSL